MECEDCGRNFSAARDLRRHRNGGQRGREKPRLPACPVLRTVLGVKGPTPKTKKAARKRPQAAKPAVPPVPVARQPVADYRITLVKRRAICDDGRDGWLVSWADTVVPDIDMNADDLVAECLMREALLTESGYDTMDSETASDNDLDANDL
ncbi:hypothetical protein HDE_13314 [Halotydeus destructor]|nr:hypothetical protein HDE_13314 [Halotydeus destructor]